MRIKTTLLMLWLALASATMAQPWNALLPSDREPNFYDYQKAFEQYWAPYELHDGYSLDERGDSQKAYGYNQFKRWEHRWSSQINPATGAFPETHDWEVYQQQVARMSQKQSGHHFSPGIWSSMGPYHSPGGYAGLGRINCVAFHPSDDEVIYAGTPAGGLWKTMNHGIDWFPLGNELASLGVSDLLVVVDNDTETLYMATGDSDAFSTYSIGVLKSTDGGYTWYTTGLQFNTSDMALIFDLVVDPDNPQRIFAATNMGVFRTMNGGNNWETVANSGIVGLRMHPANPMILYASNSHGEVYKTNNGGTTWSLSLDLLEGHYTKLGVSAANPDRVYAVVGNASSGLLGIYRSDDAGDNFSLIYNEKNLLGWVCAGDDNGGQAFYDLVIAPDPLEADRVLVGGINTWGSVDGGLTWSLVTHWSHNCQGTVPIIHADKHAIVWHPQTHALYEGNDGGLYVSYNNGINYNYLSSGMEISQMYGVASSQLTPDMVLTGLQDNGTKGMVDGIWYDVISGDGMLCYIQASNDSIQLGSLPNGEISGTTDLWTNTYPLTSTLEGSGAWVTPYLPDPTIDTILYVGYNELYRSVILGETWEQLSQFNGELLKVLDIAPADNKYIYTGTDTILYASSDRGATWTTITGDLPVQSGIITDVTVKANDPMTLWVTLGGYAETKVFESNNGGTTWADISLGLPAIPAHNLVQYNKNTTTELYVAMDVGIFVKIGNNPWEPYFEGMPNVPVYYLDIYYDATIPDNSRLRAGTYGRGLWESPLYNSSISISETFDDCYRIGPNPAGDILSITFDREGSHAIALIDMLGRTVIQTTTNERHHSLDLSRLPAGYYNLGITDANGLRTAKTVVHR